MTDLQQEKVMEFKTPPNTIYFKIADEEVLKFTNEGFYYKGEKIEDIHNIYERFNDWLKLAEIKTFEEVERERTRIAEEVRKRQELFDFLPQDKYGYKMVKAGDLDVLSIIKQGK
jgi:hypothetical protein